MAWILLFVFAALCAIATARGPPVVPSTGAVASGIYRNVFVEAGYAEADVTHRLAAIVNQLFAGNPENETLLYPAEDKSLDALYLFDVSDNDVRTEGMSYGMMAAAQLDQQSTFDRLFRWYKTYMQHTSSSDPRYGYSSWHCQTSGSSMDDNPASDGETFLVTALMVAAARWGDAGAVNYSAEAALVMDAMVGKENPPCGVQGCQSVTNMFGGFLPSDPRPPLVVFVPYASAATYTDPSYVLPSFYAQWARFQPADAAYWQRVTSASRLFFRNATHPVTGLAPDYAAFDGSPSGSGQSFSFDAWRVARNVAMDQAWYAADASWQTGFCNRLLAFFRGLSTWPNYGNQFSLDGNQIDGDHSPGLVAMNAVCALASNQSVAWDFVDALWNTTTPSDRFRYYDGVLYLEAWLHLSGNYRAPQSFTRHKEG